MDDIVRQAMAKWPNVPACFGWLGLSARGNWYMRDERAQASGTFSSGLPGSKGSMLMHTKLIEFIERNYASDSDGQWFFQNGPQRVFVELEATPWIWRIQADGTINAHDGRPTDLVQCYLDELGWLYLLTSQGFGLVHTQDMENAANFLDSGLWQLEELKRNSLQERFGYIPSPQSRNQKSRR